MNMKKGICTMEKSPWADLAPDEYNALRDALYDSKPKGLESRADYFSRVALQMETLKLKPAQPDGQAVRTPKAETPQDSVYQESYPLPAQVNTGDAVFDRISRPSPTSRISHYWNRQKQLAVDTGYNDKFRAVFNGLPGNAQKAYLDYFVPNEWMDKRKAQMCLVNWYYPNPFIHDEYSPPVDEWRRNVAEWHAELQPKLDQARNTWDDIILGKIPPSGENFTDAYISHHESHRSTEEIDRLKSLSTHKIAQITNVLYVAYMFSNPKSHHDDPIVTDIPDSKRVEMIEALAYPGYIEALRSAKSSYLPEFRKPVIAPS
jgi:hypothetical protein